MVYYAVVLYVSTFKQPPAEYLPIVWRHEANGIMGEIEIYFRKWSKEVAVSWWWRGQSSEHLYL